MAGVLEYLTFELLELASNKSGEDKGSANKKSIMPRHIMMAIKSDEEFNKFLRGADFANTGRMPNYLFETKSGKKKKDFDGSDSEGEFENGASNDNSD